MRLAYVLDLNTGLSRQRRGCLADAFAQRLGEVRVIEDADPSGVEIPRHPLGVAHRRQRPGDHQPVVTRQHPTDPVGIPLRQCLGHAVPPASSGVGYTRLIGSGSAGLGVL